MKVGRTVKKLIILLLTLVTQGTRVTGTDFPGSGTVENPYRVSSAEDWNYLAEQVNAGNSYSEKFFRLMEDISVTTMIGGGEGHAFSGTFDGYGHKLTVSISDNTTQFVAPFHRVSGGNIKNLYVDGTVNSNQYHMSGLVGRATNTVNIENCVVAVNIRMSTSYAGGFVGNVGSRQYGGESFVTLTDCLFIGTFSQVGGQKDNAAGFCGWGLSTPAFINCLENGTFNTTGDKQPFLYQGTDGYNPVSSSNSYYKHGSMSASWVTNASGMSNAALVAGLGSNWVIDLETNQPMLRLFANDQANPTLATTPATVLGEEKYVTTFYHGSLAYRLPAGALAYTAGKVGDKVVFYRIGSDSNVIPAGTAVIIVADSATVTLTKLDSTDVTARGGNILWGSDTAIATPSGTVCVLNIDEGELGFYPFTGGTIPARKAYYVEY